jgi:hypothetical protein
MERRGFMKVSGLGLLGMAANHEHARAQEEPRRFGNIRDFAGKWVGSYDGRNARMSIAIRPHNGEGSGAFAVIITFEELDRDERYDNGELGRQHVEKTDGSSHILRDIELFQSEGEGEVFLKRLYLHTWNVDYLSGISECNSLHCTLAILRFHLVGC